MTEFEIIPAIDLLGGSCVRLYKGNFNDATVYDANPAQVAKRFVAQPLKRLHVVDLDGAKAGEPQNFLALQAILDEVGDLPVQFGGGLRSLKSIEYSLQLGVDRVILGTVALKNPGFVQDALRHFPGRIAVGLDARKGLVATEGWIEPSENNVIEVARRFEDLGVVALVYTDIDRDGTEQGPNLEHTALLAESVDIPVIASGGVGTEDHLRAAVSYGSRGIQGIVIGRALYTGAVNLTRALRIAECS